MPVGPGVISLGRRPDSSIVLEDASVSGRHAELRIEGGTVELADLGSTNGTRVEGRKITTARLAHGDGFAVGAIKLVLEDAALSGGGEAPEEGLGRVSQERVARSGAGSRRGWVLALLLVLALALLGWRFLGSEKARATRTVVASVPGNLLDDFSFEGEPATVAWTSSDAAPQGFIRSASFRKSGQVGLGVALAAGEWAFASSPEVQLGPRRRLELRAWVAAEEGAEGRLGLELASSSGARKTFIAWAPSSADPAGGEVVLAFDTLPGYDRGRVVVAARAGGGAGSQPTPGSAAAVSIDDVSVVLSNAVGGPDATFNEYQAHVLGSPGSTVAVVRSGLVIFPGIQLGAWGPAGLVGWGGARWTARQSANGLAFAAQGGPPDSVCRVNVNLDKQAGDEPWLATTGPDGYRAHATEFEREAATGFLIGSGVDLMRIGFASPTRVSGSARQGEITIGFGGLEELDLQLTFREERASATQLANRARGAERESRYGAALAAWTELLDRYPFEAALVNEAENTRARLVQQGLERIEEVRRQVERARFFQLSDLYRQCRAQALEAGRSYAGSEVESEARAIVAEVDAALAELAVDLPHRSAERLRGILEALDPSKSPELRAHVQEALERAEAGGEERESR